MECCIACIASVDIINFIPYLLLSSFCIELFILNVQISSIPIMIIRAILATCFLILQRCCARSSPSGFCHFQPEFARETGRQLSCDFTIPIGRTPGHLSNAINLHATNALRPMGSTYKVHIRLPTKAMAVHNSLEALWKDEHMPIHAEKSIPDRAAAPEVLSAVERMKDPFKSSQITG